jgi:hypothetical protein
MDESPTQAFSHLSFIGILDPKLQELLREALQPSTVDSYSKAWDTWLKFLRFIHWSGTVTLRRISFDDRVLLVLQFLRYLIDRIRVTETHIVRVWAALSFFFKLGAADSTFLRSDILSLARKGAINIARRQNPKKDKPERMPVVLQMFTGSIRDDFWNNGQQEQRMLYLGASLAFLLGSRVSEYSNSGRHVDHNLISDNIYVITLTSEWVNCCDIAKRGLLGSQLKSFSLSWATTKNGKKNSFITQGISEFEDRVFDDLLDWCYSGSLELGQPFFSRVSNWTRRSLRRSEVSKFVKEMARRGGLDDAGYAPHSFRIGASSTRHALGQTGGDINRTIGWSNNANSRRIYTRQFSGVHDTSNPPDIQSLRDLQTARSIHVVASSRLPTPSLHTSSIHGVTGGF